MNSLSSQESQDPGLFSTKTMSGSFEFNSSGARVLSGNFDDTYRNLNYGQSEYFDSTMSSLSSSSEVFISKDFDFQRNSSPKFFFNSHDENSILASSNPIEINETELINVSENKGIWVNKNEVNNWKGVIAIEQYRINQDANPEVVKKKIQKGLEYVQEIAIKYLRPPSPPEPGEIFIKQEPNNLTIPAPPLIVRQAPPRLDTPAPIIIREAPPTPPKPSGRKLIKIVGKRLAPPPRKVVIERLPPMPEKPQSVFIERWLNYIQGKQRVIFQKPTAACPVVLSPRNVIIQWEAPEVVVKREVKYLGVQRANPAEYVSQYGSSLISSYNLPQFVLNIKTPNDLVLASDLKYKSYYELEGNVDALKMVNLDHEGLSEYKTYLTKLELDSFKVSLLT